ncbi:MAG: ABC-type transport auxiliary lipoprotein family protein [Rubrivivax sp.]|nr:ABC-type transport auxiliary lipoprotein family protein [Rubrivivax sp.]
MKRRRAGAALAALAAFAATLTGCVSVGVGNESAPHAHLQLADPAPPVARRAKALVAALLIQPLPADAMADSVAIAYSRQPNQFAFYQFASWTERPVRQLPRLLQRRLEASGIAAAVGLMGEPLRSDWLLTVAIDSLHHDVAIAPGQARLALTVELFDRRSRQRVARRQFGAAVATTSADSSAAATAMSQAVAQVFTDLTPWLEAELARAAAAPQR